ncbi:hypothetical protein QPK24_05800 [Paenibacillus polygoni]|uniref:Uncharacterized protein n=1 Tax=Paenibacillus polygoni TaxID=3050112 RepID=A0ABY8X921_9BACL|nr:hypothetical protein [Paenibacillus polygoni]WIV21634.1 hypothetical protein QPK24_05800 [Paenibacillus polygoni]
MWNTKNAGARSIDTRKSRERDGAMDLLERILNRGNLDKAYKRVNSKHGAPGNDGMTVERHFRGCKKIETNSYKVSRLGDTNRSQYGEKNPQNGLEWRAKALYSYGGGSHYPASHCSAAETDVRTALFERKLWLPSGTEHPAGN